MLDLLVYLLGLAVLLSFALILIRILFADGDLMVIHKRLRPEYFRDRVVWVTGASSGIGEAIVQHLSSLGAKVILSSRSPHKLEGIRESLDRPENAKVLEMDVSETASAEAAAEKAVQLFGRVEMLINCAGVAQCGLYSDFSAEVERRLFEVNFFGAVALTKAVLPYLIRNDGSRSGHICHISSMAGKIGAPGRTTYSAAKFALIGYMDGLRMELLGLGHGIAVTTVCPGPVRTNADMNTLRGDGTRLDRRSPILSKGVTPERCATLVLVGMSQRLPQVWIAKNPFLIFLYLAQYAPWLYSKLTTLAPKKVVEAIAARVDEKKDS